MRKVNLGIQVAVCVLIMMLTGPVNARIIYVDANGSADFTTIQEAIDDANDGDEIEAAQGTYNEAINFNGKAVRLYGSGGPAVTTIDANGIGGAYHAVQCVSGEDANTILEGFTVTGGNAKGPSPPDRDGGGIYNNGSSPTITNCIFIGNLADHGGGMLNVDGTPTVTDCNFENNIASGGAIGGGGICNHNSSPVLTNCIFIGNSGGPLGGGGMFNAAGSNPVLMDCTFSDNNSVDNGGGICNWYDTNSILTNCIFSGNIADSNGGGMFNYQISPTLTGCTFSENSANYGGGIYDSNSSPTVTNCIFTGNQAGGGGGMFNWGNSNPTITNCIFTGNQADGGAGVFNWDNSNPMATNCTFSGNSAYSGAGMLNYFSSSPMVTGCTFSENSVGDLGGGIYNYQSSNPTVTNCIFSGNVAFMGGGISTVIGAPTVINCTFSGNTATNGGGIQNTQSDPTVTNCTFSGNSASLSGGGMYNLSASQPTVTNCIFWGDTPNEIYDSYSSPTVTYSDVQGGYAGVGNIEADPCFVDPCNPDPNLRDFRLAPDSTCIDTGDNNSVPADIADLDNDGNTVESIPYDLDGHPRFVDGDCNDTVVVDMGAFEFNYAYTGDLDYDCTVNFTDFAIFATAWLTEPPEPVWNQFCDIGIPPDNYIDWYDLYVLVENWLESF